MALDPQNELAILQSLGFQGEDPADRDAFLRQNPHLISSFETAAQRFDNTFNLNDLRQTIAPGTPVTKFVGNQIQNPQLPGGTTFEPTLQEVQPGEELQNNANLNPTGTAITAPGDITNVPQINQTLAQNTQVDPNQAISGVNTQGETFQATLTSDVGPAVAQQGVVRDEATVAGQLQNLFGDFEGGGVPLWAVNAFNAAQDEMAARGIGSSTISAGAITQAFLSSALPIASQDASTYFQMDLTNLNNRQQTELENVRMRQQNMLTDVAIENATKQFNASSKTQAQQFVASLISSIQSQNADRATQTSVFNAAEANKISAQNAANTLGVEQFNRQQDLAVKEFNSNLQHQREVFNSQMQFAIDQSNVLWRRSINTANTAAINAANQANVQNRFNLSQQALNNIWQQWRDEAAWMFTASENQKDREFQAAIRANDRAFINNQNEASFWQSIGFYAANLLLG